MALLASARQDLGDAAKPGKGCRPVGMAKDPRTILPRPGMKEPAASALVRPKPTAKRGGRRK